MPIEKLHQAKNNNPLLVNKKSLAITLQPRTSSGSSEVIPDSEEERHILDIHQSRTVSEVIEISSDESDIEQLEVNHGCDVQSRDLKTSKSGSRLYVSHRRIIESSEDESGSEVIEISDSSVEIIPPPRHDSSKSKSLNVNDNGNRTAYPSRLDVDESIIILDEPRSARTPLRVATKKVDENASKGNNQDPTTPKKARSLASRALLNSTPKNASKGSTTSQTAVDKPSVATPRSNTQKARLAADLQKRHEYAQNLFIDLNKSVFKGGLPTDTKLNWNKRLLTTAGKAKYHRSREGVQTTEIELAEKILDCEERIRNTLSHEMCHLATWIIDKNINEHHGKLFKSWATRVMKKRPDIDVSVKHNYEISYPYQWKCEKCAKIYGRFSKSIKPEECVCGACKEGTLIPQFSSKRKPNALKLSRMAAARPQDSPRALQNSPLRTKQLEDLESDSDSDIIVTLTKSLASTSLI